MNICQNVECTNAGTKVRCVIDIDGKKEIHDIFLCRFCIKHQEDSQ